MTRLKNIKEVSHSKLGNGRARIGVLMTLKTLLFFYAFVEEGKYFFLPTLPRSGLKPHSKRQINIRKAYKFTLLNISFM